MQRLRAFVQTDHTWELGEPIGLNSISGGTQYEQWMQLYKDDDSGHWWVRVAGTWLGYWPRSWYDSYGIANFAATVQWGMEVYDDSGTYHGTANIGDGSFASSGFGHAAFQRRMRYTSDVVPGTYYWNEASTTGWIGVADSRCYTGFKGYTTNNDWMNYLYAGGPGYNWVTNGDPNVLCRY